MSLYSVDIIDSACNIDNSKIGFKKKNTFKQFCLNNYIFLLQTNQYNISEHQLFLSE